MIAFAYYLLKVIICSAALFLYYKVALKDKAFHQWNRFYLLVITVLSLVIPCLRFQISGQPEQVAQGPIQVVQVVTSADQYVEEITVAGNQTAIPAEQWAGLAYTLICVLFAFVLIRSLLHIRKLIRSGLAQDWGNIKLIESDTPGTPFSFFTYIFWNPGIDPVSETGRQILHHEMVHVQQRHTWDKMLLQVVLIPFWCNPVFWLIRRELSMIHEFIADQRSVGYSGAPALAAMILQVSCPGAFQQLVNPFFTSSIKRRLAMLTKDHTPRFRYITRIMALPVLALVGLAFTLKAKDVTVYPLAAKEPITVVIDAGHGYRENNHPDGARKDDVYEDDLVLQLAKKIKEANANKDVRIILTREDKNLVDLKQRVQLATDQGADLFISLHVAALPPSVQTKAERGGGLEVFVSRNNPATQQKSELLGAALIEQFKPIYKTYPGLLKREKVGLFVLDKNTCPAVMINCGYITNQKDFEFIKKEANQQAIAEAILKAINRYAVQAGKEAVSQRDIHQTPDGNDTIPLPQREKNSIYFDTRQKIALEADTIIYTSDRSQIKVNAAKALYIINGERTEPSILLKKTIIAKELIFYSEGDGEAVRLFGEEAKRGVIVFKGATIINTPMRVYYKSIFDRPANATSDASNKIFTKVEVMPQFPGGPSGMLNYMSKNFNQSVAVANKAPEGSYTVQCQFIVHEDGSLSNIRALTKHGYGMEEEVTRFLKTSPKWVPAVQNGRKVRVLHSQNITFVVSKEDSRIKDAPDTITQPANP